VTNTSATLTIDFYYDPSVLFQVVGLNVNGQTTWKVMGPDLNGVYGGLNGLGGFEAIVPGPELFCPVASDARGNLLVVNDGSHGGLIWNKSRPTGYGAVPGYRPPALGHNWNLIECSAWGGRPMTPFGGYQVGHRVVLADIAQWLSPDLAGHAASDNLMTFAGGDPVNLTDINGLCGTPLYRDMDRAIIDAALNDSMSIAQLLGNAEYLSRPGSLEMAGRSLLRYGELELPSDYAHNYVSLPITPLDAMSVQEPFDAHAFLASAANTLTLGLANSASVAFTGYDLSGDGGLYDNRTRWAEGIQVGSALLPFGLEATGAGSRIAGFFERMIAGEAGEAGLATRIGRFFYDSRPFGTISSEYWGGSPANGSSLHHWLFPQREASVPMGIRNAGFNLLELPGLEGVFHQRLGLNQWMGFARNWGPSAAFQASLVENAIRVGVPGLGLGTAAGGYYLGREIHNAMDGH